MTDADAHLRRVLNEQDEYGENYPVVPRNKVDGMTPLWMVGWFLLGLALGLAIVFVLVPRLAEALA